MAAWSIPAEPGEAEDVVAFLVTAVEPEAVANPSRVRTLASVVSMQGYSRAELVLVARTLPVRNAYGLGFRPDIVDEIVRESRKVRAMVADPKDGRPRLLTQLQMFELCGAHPQDFRPEDFGISGYDTNNRPFYRFARRLGPQVHDPRPLLAEGKVEAREDGGGDVRRLSDFIKQPVEPRA